jgi:hypothetical protein
VTTAELATADGEGLCKALARGTRRPDPITAVRFAFGSGRLGVALDMRFFEPVVGLEPTT